MKKYKFYAWIEKQTNQKIITVGYYWCFNKTEAKILAKADAIRAGLNYDLVKVIEE